MINVTDLSGLNLSAEQLGISSLDHQAMYNVTVYATPPLSGYEYAAIFFSFLAVVILFHELGHWLVLRKHFPLTQVKFGMWPGERMPKVWTGNSSQYSLLSAKQQNQVYISGVVFGLVPILLASIMNVVFLALLVPYILGIQSDIKLILKNMKNKDIKGEQSENKTI